MSFFEILLIVIFGLAVLDLIVGVSNDAVNFLNSAIGSKAAPRYIIFAIASVGILVGAASSSGMMEVARKGIFNPEMFSFWHIMVVFVAVVITDILLLDFYNTLRLPTSTTVSIVFELLWAASAVALWNILGSGDSLITFGQYMNRSGAMKIISGILLSVVIAFTVWLIIQYIVRLIFTYDYTKRLTRFGSVFGWVAIAIISYFLLLKGLKGSTLLTDVQHEWIANNVWILLAIFFVGWTIVLQLIQWIWKGNVLKIIVLIGTFALAAAFAGNDLVNFIGVSMASLNSYQLFAASGVTDATVFMMDGLAGKVPTNFWILLGAGIVMVITLWTSRKAARVTETEIGLTKQQVGNERFRPGPLSRALVRYGVQIHKVYQRVMPASWVGYLDDRFAKSAALYQAEKDAPAFDLVRASVNLTVASVLIAIATSMKLPLSTTYVTFMVAMGTALADGVWGRESAVYRVTGVLTVIGGRFMTALSAFVITAIIASIIYWLGGWSIAGLVVVAAVLLYKTHSHSGDDVDTDDHQVRQDVHTMTLSSILAIDADELLPEIDTVVGDIIKHLASNQDRALSRDAKTVARLVSVSKTMKSRLYTLFRQLPAETLEHGATYIQAVDYLRKIASATNALAIESREYALNQHPDLSVKQQEELYILWDDLHQSTKEVIAMVTSGNYGDYVSVDAGLEGVITHVDGIKGNQLRRIKQQELGVRNTTLYLSTILEIKNIAIYLQKLIKYGQRLGESV